MIPDIEYLTCLFRIVFVNGNGDRLFKRRANDSHTCYYPLPVYPSRNRYVYPDTGLCVSFEYPCGTELLKRSEIYIRWLFHRTSNRIC